MVTKLTENLKAMKSEIKENVQGTNSEGNETRSQINDLEQKEGRNKHSTKKRMKKQKFKKIGRGLGTSETTLNVPASES